MPIDDRRLHVFLKREGFLVNHKRLFRFYREERLTVSRQAARKRALKTRAPMTVPMQPNDRWSLDSISGRLTDGRRFRILTDFSARCACIVSIDELLFVKKHLVFWTV